MSYVKQGASTNIFATFQNVEGVETASSTIPKITITHVDLADNTITDVDNQDMTLITDSTGQYYYTWNIDSNAYTGSYLATMSGTMDSNIITGTDTIIVIKK